MPKNSIRALTQIHTMLPTQTDWSEISQGLVVELFCLEALGVETEAEERLYLTLRGRLAFALGALKRQVDRDYTVWRELKYAFFGGTHDTLPDSENSEKPEKSHQAGLH